MRPQYQVNCPVCGTFTLERNAYDDFLNPEHGLGRKLKQFQRARISHKIRNAKSVDESEPPLITSDFIERYTKDGFPGPTPNEQAISAIRYIGDCINATGERIGSLPEGFYAVIGAPNVTFAGELLFELYDRGLITGIKHQTLSSPPELSDINMTLAGWQ